MAKKAHLGCMRGSGSFGEQQRRDAGTQRKAGRGAQTAVRQMLLLLPASTTKGTFGAQMALVHNPLRVLDVASKGSIKPQTRLCARIPWLSYIPQWEGSKGCAATVQS
jgi:hypothetical protein